MSAFEMLYKKFAQQGWGIGTKLDLCMEYIDNIGDEPGFHDFLLNKAEQECWEDLEDLEQDKAKTDEEEIE